jgi:hypothetical protein
MLFNKIIINTTRQVCASHRVPLFHAAVHGLVDRERVKRLHVCILRPHATNVIFFERWIYSALPL